MYVDNKKQNNGKSSNFFQILCKILGPINEEENVPDDVTDIIRPQRVKWFYLKNKNNLQSKVRCLSVDIRLGDVPEPNQFSSESSQSCYSEIKSINKKRSQTMNNRFEEEKYECISDSESSNSKSCNREIPFSSSLNYIKQNIDEEIQKMAAKFKRQWGCPSVLIVDDQYINRFILNEFWQELNISCIEAEDGKIAVNTIINQKKKFCCEGISLILMDLNMPRMDGIQATKEIVNYQKQGIVNKEVQIVAVTAFASQEEKAKWFQWGMSKFIRKPVTLSNLIDLVK